MRRATLLTLAVLLVPAASHAQVAVRAFADAGFTTFTANQSFKAVLGKPSGFIYGGGVQVEKQQLFFAVDAQRFRRTGHRVFVFQNQVFTLNVKDTVTVTPLDLTFGYRFGSRGVIPYAGGGIGWYRYQEQSEHATDADNIQRTSTGYHVVGGAEVPIRRWLGVAVDAQWASVPNALGDSTSSVAAVYGEHDLGGFSIRTKVIVGR